ncbi:MAG: hypothetical protein MRY74_02125 [Neomegalonema sp.]|nr:hypothetical protein [Neomegalonema sp.]
MDLDPDEVRSQQADLRRASLPRRMRLARFIVAAAFGVAIMAIAVRGLLELTVLVADLRAQREAGWVGVYINVFYADNAAAARITESLAMLTATMIAGAFAAGAFTRIFRGSGWVLRHLYGKPVASALFVAALVLSAAILPYAVASSWRLALVVPSVGSTLFFVAGALAAILFGWRAAEHARLPETVKSPARQPRMSDAPPPQRGKGFRAAILARDALARSAFEKLLKAESFDVVFSGDSGESVRSWFIRTQGRADVLLLNDDVADMAPLRLITYLADDPSAPIGLVRLSPEAVAARPTGRRSDQVRGKIASVEHVQTPTIREPLVAAAVRAASAARAAQKAATPEETSQPRQNALLQSAFGQDEKVIPER